MRLTELEKLVEQNCKNDSRLVMLDDYLHNKKKPVPESEIRAAHQLAFKIFKKKAKTGNAWAQFWLAKCYQSSYGTKKDVIRGFDWAMKSAEQGNG